MTTVNSVSGGKTSAYIAANYKADFNVFALVRTNDESCIFPDAKIRQQVSDRLGVEFIGTLEDDMIIYTILDLEQFIGQKIDWVTGKTFDEIIIDRKEYLPSVLRRYCTSELKMIPIFNWWKSNFKEPVEMRIGYRANETRRADKMKSILSTNGFSKFHTVIGKSNNRNKWGDVEWRKPSFPLMENNIFKDNIEEFWKNKPVRFAPFNNCIGCFNRNDVMLKYMSEKFPVKFDWFVKKEKPDGKYGHKFKKDVFYEKIKNYPSMPSLDFDDFNECDSGYCGL